MKGILDRIESGKMLGIDLPAKKMHIARVTVKRLNRNILNRSEDEPLTPDQANQFLYAA